MVMSTFHLLLVVCAIILRLLVGLHPHSGQDNHHGSSYPSYGGDYEAQRHWMELTLHIPLREWYTHDVNYWGLDYPPLTAYISYVCGLASYYFVGPESVALYTSRYGWMDQPTLLYTDHTTKNNNTGTDLSSPRPIQYTHKAFMRLSVLFLDVCIFFTIVWILAKRLCIVQHHHDKTRTDVNQSLVVFRFILLSTLMQPSLILIDHGHFQYNNVCLGLSLWSIHYMTSLSFSYTSSSSSSLSSFYPSCIVGSIFFCLALNFKQISLYYAPAIFFYLLGRCFVPMKEQGVLHPQAWIQSITRIIILGISVLWSFFVLWYPFIYFRNSTTSVFVVISTIFQRLFPFQRGMFEGKVANIWCSLSIRPISIRSRIPTQYQPIAALVLTSILILPFCIVLFNLGFSTPNNNSKKKKNEHEMHLLLSMNHLKTLLWGCTGTALAFFLASFQVHEKSILFAVIPISLLIYEFPSFVVWFSFVAMWSMWPLIYIDRLSIAYSSCGILFLVLLLPVVLQWEKKKTKQSIEIEQENRQLTPTPTSTTSLTLWNVFRSYATLYQRVLYMIFTSSTIMMILLHGIELVYIPPSHMPDLFPMIWSVTGCIMFCISWIIVFICCYQSFHETMNVQKNSQGGNRSK